MPEKNGARALVLDDDEVFRERLCRALRSREWDAFGAADAESAVLRCESHHFELITVDLRLPGLGGLDVIRRLRELQPQAVIVVLTGYGSIATAMTAVKFGADHYLSKPADADQILDSYSKSVADEEEPGPADAPVSVPSLARVEWEHIQRVLNDCAGNITQAAKLLGLHRRSLQRKLSKYPPNN